MSVVIGGDILAIKWSNPDLGSGMFFPLANTDSTLNKGGFRGNDQPVLDGAGRMINQMNRTAWSAKMEVAADLVNSQEFETASAIAASTSETVWTIDHVSGVTYSAKGVILGSLEMNANKASFSLNICGGGQLQLV